MFVSKPRGPYILSLLISSNNSFTFYYIFWHGSTASSKYHYLPKWGHPLRCLHPRQQDLATSDLTQFSKLPSTSRLTSKSRWRNYPNASCSTPNRTSVSDLFCVNTIILAHLQIKRTSRWYERTLWTWLLFFQVERLKRGTTWNLADCCTML